MKGRIEEWKRNFIEKKKNKLIRILLDVGNKELSLFTERGGLRGMYPTIIGMEDELKRAKETSNYSEAKHILMEALDVLKEIKKASTQEILENIIKKRLDEGTKDLVKIRIDEQGGKAELDDRPLDKKLGEIKEELNRILGSISLYKDIKKEERTYKLEVENGKLKVTEINKKNRWSSEMDALNSINETKNAIDSGNLELRHAAIFLPNDVAEILERKPELLEDNEVKEKLRETLGTIMEPFPYHEALYHLEMRIREHPYIDHAILELLKKEKI